MPELTGQQINEVSSIVTDLVLLRIRLRQTLTQCQHDNASRNLLEIAWDHMLEADYALTEARGK